MQAVFGEREGDEIIQEMELSEFPPKPELQERLRELVWHHRSVLKGLRKMKGLQHIKALKFGVKPVCEPVRRRLPEEIEVEKQAMQKLMTVRAKEPSLSPSATKNLFVRKKDGGTREAYEIRLLNDLTTTDFYPKENMKDILDWLGCKRIFSTFNLKGGFFQVELHPSTKECTAIRAALGQLQYKSLPLALTSSPDTSQIVVNTILEERKGMDILVFIDDASIGTIIEEKHIDSLGSILDTLLEAGVHLKLSKRTSGVQKSEIWDHVVDGMSLRPSEKNTDCIGIVIEPVSGDEMMRLLDFVNVFSTFMDHFAEKAVPQNEARMGTGFTKRRNQGQRLIISDCNNRWGRKTVKSTAGTERCFNWSDYTRFTT